MEGNQNTTGNSRIALCLSGGGFRATLFHLGVIKALRAHFIDEEMALNQVAEVYAVSGGSILAAHMLKNWDRYTSADEGEFKQVSDELLTFAKRDVRNRVLRRAGLTFWSKKSSTQWLQDEYASKHFLGSDTLDTSYTHGEPPTFHFLTTNFNSGELCSFSGLDFELMERVDDGTFETHKTPAGSIPLAFAVAASSSFPIAFPPITLTPLELGYPEGQHFQMPIELSDGGVYDNFGIEKFVMARRAGSTPDVLIVSNAGGSFQADPQKSYDAILPRNVRASDVMMRRVGEGTLQTGRQMAGDGFILVRIGATTSSSQISKTSQQMLRLVRTDLDSFDAPLAGLLVDHGEGVARNAFEARGWQVTSEFTGHASVKSQASAVKAIERAAKRRLAGFFFDTKDWLAPILSPIIIGALAVLLLAPVYGIYSYRHNAAEVKRLGIIVDDAGKAFSDLQDKCLERGQVCPPEDYNKVAVELGKAVREVGDAASIVPERSKRPEDDRSETVPSTPTKNPQRIFIQFAGVLTRDQIISLNTELRSNKWNAQGSSGERIASAFGLNEVRYSGTNGQAARDLADAINKSGLPLAKTIGIKEVGIIGPNDLEVWISR
jgi:predicted acylesterase/phospholipase RssA